MLRVEKERASAIRLRLAVAGLAVLPSTSPAQTTPRPDPAVYVRDDDLETNRLLEEAAALGAEGKWSEAVERYLQILAHPGGADVQWEILQG